MIVTNLSVVPGKTIERTLGLAFGYASVKTKGKGKLIKGESGATMPWSDGPGGFEELFRAAEKHLVVSGRKQGGDAVIKVEGKLSRSDSGNPEIMLVGTVVSTLEGDDEGGVSIQYDGEETKWEPPSATPDIDTLKRSKGRGAEQVKGPSNDRERIMEMGSMIGFPRARMEKLFHAGFRTLDDIASASTREITSVEGINPTQARLLRKKAKEQMEE